MGIMLKVGFVVSPNFQIMSPAALSAFEFANVTAKQKLYDIHLLSETGGAVLSSLGMSMSTKPFGRAVFDTLIVGGVVDVVPSTSATTDFIQKSLVKTRRVASICTGAFALAEAGVLDGRRATTHWLLARELQKRFPKVKVEDDRIYIIDGPIWTSAGMSAGIDLALGMIEKDFGAEVVRAVAQKLVLYHRRAGGQSQHSALLEMDAKSDRIQNALAFARKNLQSPLGVEELADAAHLSPRQFSRAFRSETGQSPAKAIEHLRVEAARLMLESGRHSLDVVARETGFADRERMRRSFLRAFGQPPQVIKRALQPIEPL
jgi:transcriptional regulator GlxA family with amidase domain